MATGASLVSSWSVPRRAARVLKSLLRRVVRCPGLMWRPGDALRNTHLVLGCAAASSWPGFAASSRQGCARGSGNAIWILPSWTVTSSSVTMTSSQMSRAMFSACCPKTSTRIAAARSRVSSSLAWMTCWSAWSWPGLGSRGLVPRRCGMMASPAGAVLVLMAHLRKRSAMRLVVHDPIEFRHGQHGAPSGS